MSRTSLAGIVHGFSTQGRALLQKLLPPYASELKDKFSTVDMMCALARDLVSTRGEASGAAIAIESLLDVDLARLNLVKAHPLVRPTRRHFVLEYE